MQDSFVADNNTLLLIPLLLLLAAIAIVVVITRLAKHGLTKYLNFFLIGYIVLYLPVFDYYFPYSTKRLFWPGDYWANYSSYMQEGHEYKGVLDFVFNTLTISTTILTICSIALFIIFCNRIFNQEVIKTWINWIPVINIFSLSYLFYKNLSFSKANHVLISIWALLTLLWVYVRIIGVILIFVFDIETYTPLAKFLFILSEEDLPSEHAGYDSGFVRTMDLVVVMSPPFQYLSGIFTFVMFKQLKKIS